MDSKTQTEVAEFIRLFSLHTSSIYTYIRVLIPNRADAEDVFQETSRTLWEKYSECRLESDEHFRAWAMRIAQNKALMYRRGEGRRHKLISSQAYAILDEVALASVESLDSRLGALGDCYRKLVEEDRQLIDARYRLAKTVETIAKEMGRSVHSVYRALRRIHTALFHCVRQIDAEEQKP